MNNCTRKVFSVAWGASLFLILMRSAWPLGAAALLLSSQLLSIPLVHGASFPDVPGDYIFRASIDLLVEQKVVTGNPDGTFSPGRAVNRAEMLTMLYRAVGKIPAESNGCFSDVKSGSWYAKVVCDAAANHFVDGYSDGTFRPEKAVNRVEALKMILNMFGMPVAELSDANRGIVKFVDVSLSAWYTKYLIAAYVHAVLPVPGQSGSHFYPDALLIRGEAAAYIANALGYRQQSEAVNVHAVSSSSVSSTSASSGHVTASSSPALTIKNVDFPFSDDGKFDAARSVTYRFALKAKAEANIFVSVDSPSASITCRLYHLEDSGLSAEYYLGVQQTDGCHLRVALVPGSYQMDIGSAVGIGYKVYTKSDTSDGNDGFSEAKILLKGAPRSAAMEVDDYIDCYKFSVSQEATMTVELSTSAQHMRALIYPMDDVDLYGFSGPQTNQSYLYPTGTYYTCVQRGDQLLGKQDYTIRLR